MVTVTDRRGDRPGNRRDFAAVVERYHMGDATGEGFDDPDADQPDADRQNAGARGPAHRLGVEVDPEADGPAAFMQALAVPRNAKWGAAVGLAFTLAVFVFFVVIPGTYRSPLWYVGLAFVLAISTAGLVAFLLTLARAIRLSRTL